MPIYFFFSIPQFYSEEETKPENARIPRINLMKIKKGYGKFRIQQTRKRCMNVQFASVVVLVGIARLDSPRRETMYINDFPTIQ